MTGMQPLTMDSPSLGHPGLSPRETIQNTDIRMRERNSCDDIILAFLYSNAFSEK